MFFRVRAVGPSPETRLPSIVKDVLPYQFVRILRMLGDMWSGSHIYGVLGVPEIIFFSRESVMCDN